MAAEVGKDGEDVDTMSLVFRSSYLSEEWYFDEKY